MSEEIYREYGDVDVHDSLEADFKDIVGALREDSSRVVYCTLAGKSKDRAVGGPRMVQGEVVFPLGRVTTIYLDIETIRGRYEDEFGEAYFSEENGKMKELPLWAAFQAGIMAMERVRRLLPLNKQVYFKNEFIKNSEFSEVHQGNIEDFLFGSSGRLDYFIYHSSHRD